MKKIVVLLLLTSSLLAHNHDRQLKLIGKYLPNNPTIIEAGAHDGRDTIRMKRKWPNATIYAFEPRQDVFDQLAQKAKNHTSIHLYQLGLSDHSGVQKFYLSCPQKNSNYKADAQSSLFPPELENWGKKLKEMIDFKETIDVSVTTLDDWAREQNIKHIDFLWLDLQGNEFQVLNASPYVFSLVSVIKTEVSRKPLYKGTLPYSQFKEWFIKNGFTCIQEPRGHGDAIFVRKSVMQALNTR